MTNPGTGSDAGGCTGMKQPAPKRSKAKAPREHGGARPNGNAMNQATTDDFEREDMGIAPKE